MSDQPLTDQPQTHRRAVGAILGFDHVALTVPDLEQAVAFFVDGLGGEVVYEMGPFPARPQSSNDVQPDRFGRHPDTRPLSITMVKVGSYVFELFQFDAPDQRTDLPRWSDLGSYHVAVRVSDLVAAVDALRPFDIEELRPALPGPEDGMEVLFVRTPWGLIVELLRYPPDSPMAAALGAPPTTDKGEPT